MRLSACHCVRALHKSPRAALPKPPAAIFRLKASRRVEVGATGGARDPAPSSSHQGAEPYLPPQRPQRGTSPAAATTTTIPHLPSLDPTGLPLWGGRRSPRAPKAEADLDVCNQCSGCSSDRKLEYVMTSDSRSRAAPGPTATPSRSAPGPPRLPKVPREILRPPLPGQDGASPTRLCSRSP